ncbi:unnamed protein product [Withania somnifera]
MSTHKRKILVSNVTIKLGCSSGSCIRPKLSRIFRSSKHQHRHHKTSHTNKNYSTCSSRDTTSSTFSSDSSSSEFRTSKAVQGFGRVGGESVAVEKDSDDPYLDFRQSMLQMILEKEIYSKDDLKELLNCFLQLNSPYYHGIIVRAFTEIWNGVYSLRPNSPFLHAGSHRW